MRTPCLVVAMLCTAGAVLADPMMKPMPQPTAADAVRAGAIVEAEFLRRDPALVPTYMGGAMGVFRVLDRWSGPELTEEIKVIIAFDDGSACMPLQGWVFDEATMPTKHSKWLLFLAGPPRADGSWLTVRGNYGRWELTDAKRAEALAAMPERVEMAEWAFRLESYVWRDAMPGPRQASTALRVRASVSEANGKPLPVGFALVRVLLVKAGAVWVGDPDQAVSKEADKTSRALVFHHAPAWEVGTPVDVVLQVRIPGLGDRLVRAPQGKVERTE